MALFLSAKTMLGLVGAGVVFMFFSYEIYRLYLKIKLYNRGRPLSEEQKKLREGYRRQRRNYGRYNLYNTWYRFADATEHEYLAEKLHERFKRVRRLRV
jgi:hypothetical protein